MTRKHSSVPKAAWLLTVSSLAAGLLGGCGAESAESLLASAKDYLARGDSKAAVIQAKNALHDKPELAEARFLLGQALLRSENSAAAVIELRKASQLHYPDALVFPELARALLDQGATAEVAEKFGKVELTDSAAQAALKTSVAIAEARLGRTTAAASAVQAALRADPHFVPARLVEVRLTTASSPDRALGLLEEVLRSNAGDADAWVLFGDLLEINRQDHARAQDAYRRALKIVPGSVAGHAGLIASALAANDMKLASEQLERMKQVRARHPVTRLFEARLALHSGDDATANAIVEELRRGWAGDPQLLELSGVLAFRAGNLPQAEKDLAQALTLAPERVLTRLVLAQTYLRQGSPAKALSTIEPSLNAKRVVPEVLSVAAVAHLHQGDLETADQLFAKVAELTPRDMRVPTSRALIRVAQGRTQAGFAELHRIAAADTGSESDLALIAAYVRQRDRKAALAAIDALEKKQPGKPLAATLRGRLLMASGDAAQARKSFEQAAALDRKYFPAVEALAIMDLVQQGPTAARQRLEPFVAASPNHPRALLAIAELQSKEKGARQEQVLAAFDKAAAADPRDVVTRVRRVDYLLRAGDIKAAEQAAQTNVATFADNAEAIDALARAQLAAGDANQAIRTYNRLIGLIPKAAQPHVNLADVYTSMGDQPAAVASLKRALALKADYLPAQQRLITHEVRAGRTAAALEIAKTVQTQRRDAADGFLLEGDVQLRARNWTAASAAYRTALQRAPASSVAASGLLVALSAAGKRADAAAWSAEWRKAHPNDTAFTFGESTLALSAGDLPTAEARLRDVLRVRPDDVDALNNLAWVLASQHKDGALAFAQQADRLAPNSPNVLDTLAMVLAQQNQLAKAIEAQREAVKLSKNDPMLILRLARLYVQAGEKGQAASELDRLAKLGEGFRGQAEVAELRKQL